MSGIYDLDFSWDPAKAHSNIVKHGVGFDEAAWVLHDRLAITVFDAAHSETEERWFTVGMSPAGRLLTVSHTFVISDVLRARVRIISARKATRNERRQYEEGR
ncbi:MAG: BrnT family toxin [Azoarcus sp.]|jgi:uncharacterized DUF497 family protein|nr:BrnT family toxin [Azoarcus sp.]